ncbi:MAG: histidinol dehydrogenase [Acidimicrobiales bacterium]|nr:histidinol dehydrogenase [Acidimicrobiales bacterium]MYG61792.1 histidinol dehydrogenase [Acidimicrobiales bacterium]MYJ46126.1 histidinol dehydrogenase [Acidimicrobiales bacterium]
MDVSETVSEILADISTGGIDAVRRYSRQFDNWDPPSYRVAGTEVREAQSAVEPRLVAQIDFALERIRSFAEAQKDCIQPLEHTAWQGMRLGHRIVPVRSAGCYVPGGVYPLIASALMTIAVAKVAGVERVVACAPAKPGRGVDPVQLTAMARAGADEIYAIGGIQALAAMAYGVEGFGGAVDLLCGAGNAFVAEAKRQLFGTVGIDLLAGPTEVLLIADETADPELLAYDLLGQAEHGTNSPAALVTVSERIGAATIKEIDRLLGSGYPTADVVDAAWRDYGCVVLCDTRESAAAVADDMAPEHLEVHAADLSWWHNKLRNYGTIFLGSDATVAYSDKAIGTNHVLPTRAAARYTSGLWVGSFLKTPTYQYVDDAHSAEGVAQATAAISDAEGMFGHALTATVRLGRLGSAVRGDDHV